MKNFELLSNSNVKRELSKRLHERIELIKAGGLSPEKSVIKIEFKDSKGKVQKTEYIWTITRKDATQKDYEDWKELNPNLKEETIVFK